ncbi:MAG: hypothetical protein CGU28_03370 [Candidatus Dactylopiibacterium carminicum]|uniref:Stage II sporulation protein M n=1 Tax=Candidatus Dactylopiibacterium carminicum TaxID=857335 RepID=A0A272EY99_9RHOO|nr:stage II sporulation protein M [Candidatus Dactylopiibacterium carminicum]KAF7600476.1 stage II sporulation protein M [Candidatus Dactylopiibacterium carminicum]PAS95098.1 MAG: hypothetical protein CGU29_01210 [Candidatus Dactylopiibacterium carminicum]PAS97794.1 MAG: hypothetical protein CGU28_03370 [Candidatus Dactylopiibacterium carminicum]PAT00474.1 MAG: hypothetical protein BSR46_02745 [Candidatus Dactylopiibacterium carminicum]
MKQAQFEALHETGWQAFADWLKKRRGAQPPFPPEELPARYRNLCQQLALTRERDYSLALVERLHDLVQQGHDHLYSGDGDFWRRLRRYAGGGFAADVRAHRVWVLAAALLLFGPMLLMMLAVHLNPEFAYLVVSPEQVRGFVEMYRDGTTALGRTARDAGTDFSMFGFYIFNNVSIAFRCFAGGLLGGVLTVFSLVFNGLLFGVVEMRLVQAGLGENFYSFVVGHSGFELGGIVLAGAAGLRLGAALLAPGRRSRSDALRETGRSLIGMVCGLAVMLVIAALIEAFWSPLRLPFPVKLGVGGALSLLPMLYFVFAGRRHGT